MGNYYDAYDSGRSYHRYFSALRGVDLSADPSEVSRSHFCALENMWCDPAVTDGVATETFPGFRTFARFGAPILGIFRHRTGGEDYLVVHAGERLYRFAERLRNFECTLALLSPYEITLKAERGCAFSYGERLCLLVGGKYLCIDRDGALHSLEDEQSLAYIPMTYFNGEPYEQRNLLCDRVRMGFTADGPYASEVNDEGLVFTVLNEEEKTCLVRMSTRYRGAGKVTVPASTVIGAEVYTVKALGSDAFAGMMGLVSVTLPETVTIIGPRAFYGDSALSTLSLPTGVSAIGKEAFFGCLSLEKLFLGGASLTIVREGAFTYCQSLREVRFGGTQEEYAAVSFSDGAPLEALGATVVYENAPYENLSAVFRYPLYEPCLSIEEVSLSGLTLLENFIPVGDDFIRYRPVWDGEIVTHIELTCSNETLLSGKTLCVCASVSATTFSLPQGAVGFGVNGREALCGCRAVGKYDGRVFFTGNEQFPNTVFYSALDDSGTNNPFYIGCLNYFNDGTGFIPNRGFLVTGGLLGVLKADAGGEGEIFFHSPASGQSDLVPRIYPCVSAVPGVGLAGECTATFDRESVFLGKNGLFAVKAGSTENERVLYARSTAVNLHLLCEELGDAQMVVFEGMLYLLTRGRIYLADSRRRSAHASGEYEYEWYRLSGIGSYAGDTPVYRYTALLPEGSEALSLKPHPAVGEVAEGTVYSAKLDSQTVYYVKNDEGCFPVDTDGERTGGVFYPATVLCATDEALYFGTKEGAVGCFNTDKRGQALYCSVPSSYYLKEENGTYTSLYNTFPMLFSEDSVSTEPLYIKYGDKYVRTIETTVFHDAHRACLAQPIGERTREGRIHRYYYSFDGHAYPSFCALAVDDGGIPHYAKDTVPRSPTVKLKALPGCTVSVSVRTDRHPFRLCDRLSPSAADAGNADFSAFDFHTDDFASLTVREKERGWCYKQYLFSSEGHRAPFGIYSLSYSFRPSGRIKP